MTDTKPNGIIALRTSLIALAFMIVAFPAAADRPVTAAEREALLSAIAPLGCTATKIEFDPNNEVYEVDDANCNDGRSYDFELDGSFKVVDGERPVTDEERVQINETLAALGCSADLMEFDVDDRLYEVDGASCSDGHEYDIELEGEFRVVTKRRDR
ncbi:MAG: hypothetical protein GY789_11040 [Hyphomicrobiales bacterium]|nr:hypothetical protein [Hyphomicrobiales bacterium]